MPLAPQMGGQLQGSALYSSRVKMRQNLDNLHCFGSRAEHPENTPEASDAHLLGPPKTFCDRRYGRPAGPELSRSLLTAGSAGRPMDAKPEYGGVWFRGNISARAQKIPVGHEPPFANVDLHSEDA